MLPSSEISLLTSEDCFRKTRLLGHADDHSTAARQFLLGNFGHELQIDSQAQAFLPGRIVEKVNHISSKAVLDPAAGAEVERTGRIPFQFLGIAQGRTELPLESERS